MPGQRARIELVVGNVKIYLSFIANTGFAKRDEHLIGYKSGERSSQIDFVMVRRHDRKNWKECLECCANLNIKGEVTWQW